MRYIYWFFLGKSFMSTDVIYSMYRHFLEKVYLIGIIIGITTNSSAYSSPVNCDSLMVLYLTVLLRISCISDTQ